MGMVGSTHAVQFKVEVEALSVVGVQYAPVSAQTMEDVDKNIETCLEWMDRAAVGFPGFDLIVFTECHLQGFHPTEWKVVALDMPGPRVQKLQDKCKELGVWGIFSFLRKHEDPKKNPYNSCIMVNPHGEVVHVYNKVNPWSPGEPSYAGKEVPVTEGPKGSRIATIICADGDYPEIWREAAFNGANVIVRVSHYMAPWDNGWVITNRAGAYCNQCYVVGVNSVGIDEAYSYFGNSMIVNPDGTILVEAPKGLAWMIKADIFPALVDQIRRGHTTSNFLYSFKHRGFGGAGMPEGDTSCPYRAYRDWGSEPVLPPR